MSQGAAPSFGGSRMKEISLWMLCAHGVPESDAADWSGANRTGNVVVILWVLVRNRSKMTVSLSLQPHTFTGGQVLCLHA